MLIAHSTGGQIAIRLLQRHPKTFDGVILSAPLFALDQRGWPERLARGLARLAVMAGLGDRYIPGARRWQDQAPRSADGTSRTSSDPIRDRVQRAWARANPHLRCGGATFAWLYAVYRSFSATDDPAVWRSIRTPILIGSAGLDSFVRPEAHRRRSLQLPHCTLVEFPTARHELFMESEAIRDRWFAAIDAFIAGLNGDPAD
jgi:lysophospholipase